MKSLIDGDILLYRVGFTTEEEDEDIARWRMEDLVTRILEESNADEYAIYFSPSRTETFRAKLNPLYKAHRTQPKPKHYEFLKKYLMDVWGAMQEVDQEADDALGIEQTYLRENEIDTSIICSIDKDLLQIEGFHYNFVKGVFTEVSKEEGNHWFWKQLLIGDVADNVQGVIGIGPAKAEKALKDLFGGSDIDYYEKVKGMYSDCYTDLTEEQIEDMILMNGRMLKIRTHEGELWEIPRNGNEVDGG